MRLRIQKRFLVFPVNHSTAYKRLRLTEDGKELYAINIKLDSIAPDFYAYIDVARFAGRELTLSVSPQMELQLWEADTIDLPDLYAEPLRPQVHFTAKNGWLNDPNGLCYLNGEYHMFFQHNPAGIEWQNMHWGHAVSRDLVHWEERDVALFPDEAGDKFSGCAIVDEQNLLGLNTEAQKAAILYYTATRPFAQWMAVSTDGFRTIRKYKEEAILPREFKGDRDPKIIFCVELGCYVMALYLHDNDYAFYRSNDLVHWEKFFTYTLEGEIEFPDILPFKSQTGKTKYIVTSNTDHYVVMEVENGNFVIKEGLKALFYGSKNHSPISFWGVPDGRCIRAVWHNYGNAMYSERFRGELIVLEYTMEEHGGKCYLSASPVREMESLYCHSEIRNDLTVTAESVRIPLLDAPYLIRISGEALCDAVIEVKLFGRVLTLDLAKNELRFPWRGTQVCPLCVVGDTLNVTILIDRLGFEIYADGGKVCMYCVAENAVPDRNLPYAELSAKQGKYTLDTLELHALGSIWKNHKERE